MEYGEKWTITWALRWHLNVWSDTHQLFIDQTKCVIWCVSTSTRKVTSWKFEDLSFLVIVYVDIASTDISKYTANVVWVTAADVLLYINILVSHADWKWI